MPKDFIPTEDTPTHTTRIARMRMFVFCCVMASAAAFVATPFATRRGPLALRVATALPVMNIDPADAAADPEGAAMANITEVSTEPAKTREEEKLNWVGVAKKAAPVVAVAGAVFVIATTLFSPPPAPPPAPPPPIVAGKQKGKVDKKNSAAQPVAAKKVDKKVAAKAAEKAKEAEKKAAEKAKKDKKAAKSKPTPAVVAPVATAGKAKAAPLLTPEARAQRTASEVQEVAKTTEGATISAAKKVPTYLLTRLTY